MIKDLKSDDRGCDSAVLTCCITRKQCVRVRVYVLLLSCLVAAGIDGTANLVTSGDSSRGRNLHPVC